jgi:hypothetical protein
MVTPGCALGRLTRLFGHLVRLRPFRVEYVWQLAGGTTPGPFTRAQLRLGATGMTRSSGAKFRSVLEARRNLVGIQDVYDDRRSSSMQPGSMYHGIPAGGVKKKIADVLITTKQLYIT